MTTPVALLAVLLSAAPASAETPSTHGPVRLLGSELTAPALAGAGAALVSVPAAVYLAAWVGTWSNNLILAALPALGVFIALPAIAVTLAEWLVFRIGRPEGLCPMTPGWVAAGVQLVAFGVSFLLALNPTMNLLHLGLLTLAEVIVLPAAVTWAMAPRPMELPPGRSAGGAAVSLFEVTF